MITAQRRVCHSALGEGKGERQTCAFGKRQRVSNLEVETKHFLVNIEHENVISTSVTVKLNFIPTGSWLMLYPQTLISAGFFSVFINNEQCFLLFPSFTNFLLSGLLSQ